MNDVSILIDRLIATRKRITELMNPIDLLRALSRDRPNPNFFKMDTSASLIESSLFLKAIYHPQSLIYFIPSITSVETWILQSFRVASFLIRFPFALEIRWVIGIDKRRLITPTKPAIPIKFTTRILYPIVQMTKGRSVKILKILSSRFDRSFASRFVTSPIYFDLRAKEVIVDILQNRNIDKPDLIFGARR